MQSTISYATLPTTSNRPDYVGATGRTRTYSATWTTDLQSATARRLCRRCLFDYGYEMGGECVLSFNLPSTIFWQKPRPTATHNLGSGEHQNHFQLRPMLSPLISWLLPESLTYHATFAVRHQLCSSRQSTDCAALFRKQGLVIFYMELNNIENTCLPTRLRG